MSYLGSWKLNDNITFSVNTHRVDTGAATDADAVPTYRVYEDETAAPLTTGSMILFDSANTAGYYTERFQITSAAGYQKGSLYHIYVTATVNSVEGTKSFVFQVEAEVDANVVSDKTGYSITAGGIAPGAFSTAAIDANAIATDAIGAAELATDAVNEIRDAILADSTPFNGADIATIASDVVLIYSDTTAIHSDTTIIHSDTIVISSDTAVIESDTTAIHSDTTIIHSDTIVISSDTAVIESDTTAIHSDTTIIASDVIVLDANLVLVDTTITVTSQTVFTLAAGATDNNAYIDQTIVLTDTTNSNTPSVRRVTAYTGATKQVTIDVAPDFTIATGDGAKVYPTSTAIAKIYSDTTIIHSDTIVISSDTAVIESDTTAIHSDTTIIASDVVLIYSDTAVIESDTTAIHSDTTIIASDVVALNNISVADILTTQMTEAYAADGVAPTLAQALFLIQQSIGDFSISGTTLTVKKLDGTTAAATYTLDDASDPTSRTRST